MSDYTELKRLAEAHVEKDIVDAISSTRVMLVEPKTVLGLIAENARLANDHADLALRNKVLRERPDLAADRIICHDQVTELQAERDQIKTENESLRDQLEDADEQVVALEKQVKALIRASISSPENNNEH